MKYIWVNPVVIKMYEQNALNLEHYLSELGLTVLHGDLKILDKVRNEFATAANASEKVVLDTRCPLAIEAVKAKGLDLDTLVPDIHPILIQTAFSLYELHIRNHPEHELYIMCPCQSLSTLGNNLAYENQMDRITFYSWKQWQQNYTFPAAPAVDATPIPLGFFRDMGLRVKELTGPDMIDVLSANPPKTIPNIDIIEMLYCKGGCHNGDGV